MRKKIWTVEDWAVAASEKFEMLYWIWISIALAGLILAALGAV